MTDLCSLTLKEAIDIAKKDGVQPILNAFQDRTQALNPKINAFLRFSLSLGERKGEGVLYGVPISIKDNI